MKKQSLRFSMIATPLMIVCGLLATSTSARADSEDAQCSNRTLHGNYIETVAGLILPGSVPIQGVGIIHFDGEGNLSEVGHVVINGVPPPIVWGPRSTGSTYQINADCTGTVRILVDPTSGFFLNLALVVLRNGKEAHAVVTGPYFGPIVMSQFAYIKN